MTLARDRVRAEATLARNRKRAEATAARLVAEAARDVRIEETDLSGKQDDVSATRQKQRGVLAQAGGKVSKAALLRERLVGGVLMVAGVVLVQRLWCWVSRRAVISETTSVGSADGGQEHRHTQAFRPLNDGARYGAATISGFGGEQEGDDDV